MLDHTRIYSRVSRDKSVRIRGLRHPLAGMSTTGMTSVIRGLLLVSIFAMLRCAAERPLCECMAGGLNCQLIYEKASTTDGLCERRVPTAWDYTWELPHSSGYFYPGPPSNLNISHYVKPLHIQGNIYRMRPGLNVSFQLPTVGYSYLNEDHSPRLKAFLIEISMLGYECQGIEISVIMNLTGAALDFSHHPSKQTAVTFYSDCFFPVQANMAYHVSVFSLPKTTEKNMEQRAEEEYTIEYESQIDPLTEAEFKPYIEHQELSDCSCNEGSSHTCTLTVTVTTPPSDMQFTRYTVYLYNCTGIPKEDEDGCKHTENVIHEVIMRIPTDTRKTLTITPFSAIPSGKYRVGVRPYYLKSGEDVKGKICREEICGSKIIPVECMSPDTGMVRENDENILNNNTLIIIPLLLALVIGITLAAIYKFAIQKRRVHVIYSDNIPGHARVAQLLHKYFSCHGLSRLVLFKFVKVGRNIAASQLTEIILARNVLVIDPNCCVGTDIELQHFSPSMQHTFERPPDSNATHKCAFLHLPYSQPNTDVIGLNRVHIAHHHYILRCNQENIQQTLRNLLDVFHLGTVKCQCSGPCTYLDEIDHNLNAILKEGTEMSVATTISFSPSVVERMDNINRQIENIDTP